MSLTRTLFFNTVAQYLGKFLSLISSIIITALLTSRLGVEGYGQYIYIFSLVMLFFTIADWGSTFIAIREASQTPKPSLVFSTTLFSRLVFSFFITVVFLLLSLVYPPLAVLKKAALAASLLLPLLSLKTSLQVIFQTKLQLWRLGLIDTLISFLFLLFILLLPASLFSSTSTLLLLSASTFLGSLFGVFLALRLTSLPLIIDQDILKDLIRSSLSMGLLLTLFTVYNRLDIVILEHFHGQATVGLYGLGYKIYENLVIGAGFLANTTFPILAANSKSRPKFRLLFEKNLAALLLLGLPATLFAFFLARPIILLIAGPSFSESILVLQLLSPAIVIAYLNHAVGYSLVALKKQHLAAITAAIALVFNTLLNLLLVPRFTLLASAALTTATELLVLLLNSYLLLRFLHFIRPSRVFRYFHPLTILRLLHR